MKKLLKSGKVGLFVYVLPCEVLAIGEVDIRTKERKLRNRTLNDVSNLRRRVIESSFQNHFCGSTVT